MKDKSKGSLRWRSFVKWPIMRKQALQCTMEPLGTRTLGGEAWTAWVTLAESWEASTELSRDAGSLGEETGEVAEVGDEDGACGIGPRPIPSDPLPPGCWPVEPTKALLELFLGYPLCLRILSCPLRAVVLYRLRAAEAIQSRCKFVYSWNY